MTTATENRLRLVRNERGETRAQERERIVAAFKADWSRTVRWITPAGHTVETVRLSHTPNPSRPYDPEFHVKPRDYYRVTGPGAKDAQYAKNLDVLEELAREQNWSLPDLAPVPSAVVVDPWGGNIGHDEDGVPFDRKRAATFAAGRNAGLKPGHEHSHRVFALVEVPTDHLLDVN